VYRPRLGAGALALCLVFAIIYTINGSVSAMATDLPEEEFGHGPRSDANGANGRHHPPQGSEAKWEYSEEMSDEGRSPPEREDDIILPPWLAEETGRPGGADALIDEVMAAQQQLMRATAALAPGIPRRRYIYKSSESTRVPPRLVRCRVTIVSAAGEFTGEAEGPEIRGVRAEIAARAALEALNRAERGRVALALKGARVLRVFESPIIVVGVYGLNTGESIPLVGACFIHNQVEQAAILATLQAADRWLAWQARKNK
jgi:hypothetical protein